MAAIGIPCLEDTVEYSLGKGCMSALPDSVQLQVLSLLDTRQVLLAARGVSRRWRLLSKHPDVWRWRCVADQDWKLLEAVLGWAPCLFRLELWQPSSLRLITNRACAAAQLSLQCGESTVATAATLVQWQAGLGRLRSLTICFNNFQRPLAILSHNVRAGLEVLLDALDNIQGLETLMLDCSGVTRCFRLELPQRSQQEASLKQVVYHVPALDEELVFLLGTHARSLEVVRLSFAFPTAAESGLFPARLLERCGVLQELECPLLDDMMLLECCPRLTSLSLVVALGGGYQDRVEKALRSAARFLVQAVQLQSLTLRFCLAHSGVGLRLLDDVMGAVGGSYLRELQVFLSAPTEPKLNKGVVASFISVMSASLLLSLQSRLPFLPALRSLTLGHLDIFPSFLLAVRPGSAPNLRELHLELGPGCAHALVHRADLVAMLRGHPDLHVFALVAPQNGSCGLRDICRQEPCHLDLRRRLHWNRSLGLYGHHPSQHCDLHVWPYLWVRVGENAPAERRTSRWDVRVPAALPAQPTNISLS